MRRLAVTALSGWAGTLLAAVAYWPAIPAPARAAIAGPLGGPWLIVAAAAIVMQVAAWSIALVSERLSRSMLIVMTAACVATLLGIAVVRETIRLAAVDLATGKSSTRRPSASAACRCFSCSPSSMRWPSAGASAPCVVSSPSARIEPAKRERWAVGGSGCHLRPVSAVRSRRFSQQAADFVVISLFQPASGWSAEPDPSRGIVAVNQGRFKCRRMRPGPVSSSCGKKVSGTFSAKHPGRSRRPGPCRLRRPGKGS